MRSLELLTNKRHGVQSSSKILDLKCCISFIKACRQAHLEHNGKLGSMGILPYIFQKLLTRICQMLEMDALNSLPKDLAVKA
jgi:hypothetical protein